METKILKNISKTTIIFLAVVLFVFYLPPAAQSATSNIGIASVRIKSSTTFADKMTDLVNKVNRIASEQGSNVDIIVTPENSLNNGLLESNYAVNAFCDSAFNNCQLTNAGGSYSEQVLSAVSSLKSSAMANGTYLFIGSLVERFDASGTPAITDRYIYFNDLLVISPEGKFSIRRKSANDIKTTCLVGTPCYNAVEQEAFRTVRAFTITTHSGQPVPVFPIICGERSYQPLIDLAVNKKIQGIGFLINSEREGDTPYQTITEAIQNGLWTNTMPGWSWSIINIFQKNFVNSGIINRDGYLVVSEGATSSAGLIQLNEPPTPVGNYHLLDAYMFGTMSVSYACTPGDANSDSLINISDVQICINVILGSDTIHKTCSDMNGDSNVNITDCQTIINKILNP